MRLAVFTSRFPGSVNTFFARDVRGLIAAGCDVDVYPLYPETPALWAHVPAILSEAVLPRDRVRYTSPIPRPGSWKSVRRRSEFAADGLTAVRESAAGGVVPAVKTLYAVAKAWNWAPAPARYDHVLGYWGNFAATAAYLFAQGRGLGEPFSIFLHAGTDLYRDRFFLVQKLAAASRVIVCSDFNQGFLHETFPQMSAAIDAKLIVHQHGLELEDLPYGLEGREAARVVGVGGLQKKKGFDFLIRACRVLADRGVPVELELVGDGPERAALTRLARELRLDDRVRFRGWLPFPEARDAIRRSTVLAHPSTGLGDGAPNVIKEAMALGTPVVASAVAGIPDLLEHGRCGLLVRPQSLDELADAVGRLIGNGELRRSIAERARAVADARFDLFRNGRVLADFLRDGRRAAAC